jgi:hypothetical protein
MKTLLITLFGLGGITLIIEISLRLFLGLGNPPLYIGDETIGYLLAPNQAIRRKGNQIKINQYSMRSDEITAEKPQGSTRIMLLGDSIVNGGWWTDQKDILSEIIEAELAKNSAIEKIEVFNASANSWNPRNELAYLKRFGLFEADLLVLVINTDDLFGTAPTSVVVGKDINYRDRKPLLALVELYERYFFKQKPIPQLETIKKESGDRVGLNLEAIASVKAIADNNNTQFILVITPLLRELEIEVRDYEQKARNRLQELVEQQQITYIDFLPIFADFPQPEFLYRDRIHLSPQGETIVSKTLVEAIEKEVASNK